MALRYRLTTDHAASSYGAPVLVDMQTGVAYGPADVVPIYNDDLGHGITAAELVDRNSPDMMLIFEPSLEKCDAQMAARFLEAWPLTLNRR